MLLSFLYLEGIKRKGRKTKPIQLLPKKKKCEFQQESILLHFRLYYYYRIIILRLTSYSCLRNKYLGRELRENNGVL